jgi:hypothetical protein
MTDECCTLRVKARPSGNSTVNNFFSARTRTLFHMIPLLPVSNFTLPSNLHPVMKRRKDETLLMRSTTTTG